MSRVGLVARVDQRVIGGFDTVRQVAGQEQQGFFRGSAVGDGCRERNGAEIDQLVAGQGWVGSFVGSPGPASCAMRWNFTGPFAKRCGNSSIRKSVAWRRPPRRQDAGCRRRARHGTAPAGACRQH